MTMLLVLELLLDRTSQVSRSKSLSEFHMKTAYIFWTFYGFIWRGKGPHENNQWENSHDKNKYQARIAVLLVERNNYALNNGEKQFLKENANFSFSSDYLINL